MISKSVFTVAGVIGLAAVVALPRAILRAGEPNDAGGLIQVQVKIPATPSPTADRDVGERFVDAMADAFRGWGYRGKVKYLDDLDKPDASAPLLRVNLIEWQRDHVGNIVCRLAAALVAGDQEESLGTFDGLAPGVAIAPGRPGVADALDDAAKDALSRLYDALAKTDRIVGLRPR